MLRSQHVAGRACGNDCRPLVAYLRLESKRGAGQKAGREHDRDTRAVLMTKSLETSMKRWMSIVLVTAFAAVGTAPAWAADKAPNAGQERMKSCNAKAADKKGDDRKAFMKDCLSAEKKASESKMGACNTKTKGLKGDEHKKAMSDCMKAA
jgi:hypothetical protein